MHFRVIGGHLCMFDNVKSKIRLSFLKHKFHQTPDRWFTEETLLVFFLLVIGWFDLSYLSAVNRWLEETLDGFEHVFILSLSTLMKTIPADLWASSQLVTRDCYQGHQYSLRHCAFFILLVAGQVKLIFWASGENVSLETDGVIVTLTACVHVHYLAIYIMFIYSFMFVPRSSKTWWLMKSSILCWAPCWFIHLD